MMYHPAHLPAVHRQWEPQTSKLRTVHQEKALAVGCNLGVLLESVLIPHARQQDPFYGSAEVSWSKARLWPLCELLVSARVNITQ